MDKEIETAKENLAELLEEYQAWSSKIVQGTTGHSQFFELTDFVNFRMETVDTCRLLLENDKVADTLALNRSLLENYLLLILMCRGTKYIRLGNFKGDKRKIEDILTEERKKIGTGSLLAVEPYPQLRKHLLYVFEGLRPKNKPDEPPIPYHHFLFREFRPDVYRLDEAAYFRYYEPTEEVDDSDKRHRTAQRDLYNLYLSYDAVRDSLKINEITDRAALLRIDAHYTFLGTFVHPTSDAFRDLRKDNNQHSFSTMIGFDKPYTQAATILGYLYTLYNASGIIGEMINVIKSADSEYIVDPRTNELEAVIAKINSHFNYFWYIFNEASDYDKFNYCVNVMKDKEFNAIGRDYTIANSTDIPFNKEIYGNLQSALGGWSNVRVGKYVPPYAR